MIQGLFRWRAGLRAWPACILLVAGLALVPGHSAAQRLDRVQKIIRQEVRFKPFTKVELADGETCPTWLDITRMDGMCRKLSVIYRDVYLSGFLIEHRVPSDQLTIFHEGHNEKPQNAGSLQDPLVPLLPVDAAWFVSQKFNSGSDVLVLFMPGMGLEPIDESPAVQRLHSFFFNHNSFALLDLPGDGAAAYFVAHVKAFLDRYARGYRRVTMMGRSGGGWATTLAAAVEPRIKCSISFFGTLPLRLRLPVRGDERDDLGDYEQYGLSLLRRVDYLDLYAAASVPGRNHTQVYNLVDECCFSGEVKGRQVQGMFAAQYSEVKGFRVELLPARSDTDHANLDETALAVANARCGNQ